MSDFVNVIVIESLSYTGTTWLNVVLGSHEHALATGPPHRAWMSDDGRGICRVHGEECDFWPGFRKQFDREKDNFFVSLARYSGRNYIITNNLSVGDVITQLQHPKVLTKRIRMVRDGRALAASFARHYPEKGFLESLGSFLNPAFETFDFDPDNTEQLCLKYEDVLRDKISTIQKCGEFVGLSYDESCLRFWEYPHHLSSANHGLVAMLKLGQGLEVGEFEDRDYYIEQFERTKKDPASGFTDRRWRSELSKGQLFLFDLCFGKRNSEFGYERDMFSLDEFSSYLDETYRAVESGIFPDIVREKLETFRDSIDPGESRVSRKSSFTGASSKVGLRSRMRSIAVRGAARIPLAKRLLLGARRRLSR